MISKLRRSIKSSITSIRNPSSTPNPNEENNNAPPIISNLRSHSPTPSKSSTTPLSSLPANSASPEFASAADGDVAFEVDCEIDALTECPQRGYFFVKWKHSQKKQGSTPLIAVEDNKAVWKHQFVLEVNIPVNKENMVLEDCYMRFSVRRERPDGFTKVGHAKVNLSEFACTRTMECKKTVKLLLQNSVVNSALSVSIGMKQVAGSPFFKSPPSKGSRMMSSAMNLDEEIDSSTSAMMLLKKMDNPEFTQLRRGSSQSGSDEEVKEPIVKSKVKFQSSELFGLLGDSMVVDAVQDHLGRSPNLLSIHSVQVSQSSSPYTTPLASPRTLPVDEFERPRRNHSDEPSVAIVATGGAYHFSNYETSQDVEDQSEKKKSGSNPSSSRKLELLMLIDEVMDKR
eukprot:TRINITY_DN11059_c0_g3_i1.p1 TRINITY_DN11059_c0_g3~~TRINITY_DN11059_c0_g3_i1.p1  ORF type:complete len:399 (-),score=119.82 TRINITY_DN11059_c0_g3_i1:49-1245(-)